MKTAQPPLKSPATPKPVRKPEARPISREEWAGYTKEAIATPKPVRKPEARPISRAEWASYTKEAIAKYGNTLRALSK